MRRNNAITTAISASAITATSAAINCENFDGVMITVDEDAAALAGTMQILANEYAQNATTLVDTAALTTWRNFGSAVTLASPGAVYYIEPVPNNIKILFTRTGGTGTIKVHGYTRGS
jgi:hypothetical protein